MGNTLETKRDFTSTVSEGQGLYYTVSGLWPLISLRTFTLVTGPKVDLWLVKTVGGHPGGNRPLPHPRRSSATCHPSDSAAWRW